VQEDEALTICRVAQGNNGTTSILNLLLRIWHGVTTAG
jgi:hypothetical protein